MQVGINQSPNRYYPVNKFQPNYQKAPNYFNPITHNTFRQTQQHANQGQGSIEFDGKRLRKAVSRKTVDYNSVIVKYLEARPWQRDVRDRRAIQPDVGYYTEILPPISMLENPINSVTTKFVRTSTNKMRCPIFCVVWTPEGRRLITGASSGEFTLWNGLTFNFETILQAHDSPVRCMVWSHNDTWMVTGDHSGYVKYWQSNMNNVKMFQAHKEPLRGISFCPTDTKFVTASDDGTVRIWDFLRCTEEKILRGHGADVKCVAWHPQKALIVSGSKDSQQPIKLWDAKSGTSLATIHAHKSTVMEVKWNQNGTWMLTASRDHLLKLFDIRNLSQEIQTFRGHKKEATSISWHPVHESMFVSGGSDGSVMFWVVGAEKEVGGMEQAHDSCVWSLAWHPLGHILCSGSNDHTSKFWTRNRPGDRMRDKYNLNTLPKGLDETNEYDDVSTISLVIPGMGMEMGGNMADQTGLSLGGNTLGDLHAANQAHRTSGISETVLDGIPGLDFGEENANDKQELQQQQRKVPFSKPIPRQFQQQWSENKQPLLLAPPTATVKEEKKNIGPLLGPPGGEQHQGMPNQPPGPMPMNMQMGGMMNPMGGTMNHMGPPNQMGGPPNQMGGPPNQMGGPPNQMGGPPNQMGGPPNQMGGPPNQMSGPPNQMGGPPNQMGGPPNQMGGPPNQMGGPPNQMGGPPNQMGGPPNQMGGPPNQMGGPPNQMGGPPNQMGGPPNQMGGPHNQMGGPPNQMGEPPNQMGGPPNQMGGPSSMMPGPPNQMGGPPNQMGGPSNQMGGSSNQMGMFSNQMGGPNNQMGGGGPNQMGMQQQQNLMPGNQNFPSRTSRTSFVTSHPNPYNQQDPQQGSAGPQGNQSSRTPLLGQHPGFGMNTQEESEFPQQRPGEDQSFWSTHDAQHSNEPQSFRPNQQQENDLEEQEDFDERTTGGGSGIGQMNRAPMMSNMSFHSGNNFEGNFQQNRDFSASMEEEMRNGDSYNSAGGPSRKRQWNEGSAEGSFSSGNSNSRNYNMRGGSGRGMGGHPRGGRSMYRRGGGNSGMYRGGRGSRRGSF